MIKEAILNVSIPIRAQIDGDGRGCESLRDRLHNLHHGADSILFDASANAFTCRAAQGTKWQQVSTPHSHKNSRSLCLRQGALFFSSCSLISTTLHSRQAIKKYIQANNTTNAASSNVFDSQFNRALKNGVDKGEFSQPKGTSRRDVYPVLPVHNAQSLLCTPSVLRSLSLTVVAVMFFWFHFGPGSASLRFYLLARYMTIS